MKNLFYLDELSDYKVASDYSDVRGWEVKDADDRVIGRVDNLLVNKKAERVVYLDIEVDKSIIEKGHEPYEVPASEGTHEFVNKDGENHLILPIGLASLDEENELVYTDEVNFDTFRRTKRFNKGAEIERDYEVKLLQMYNPKENYSSGTDTDEDFYGRKEFTKRTRRK